MGRRVTSTTKGGKYMNPTDQARKQARKKELRKNKKQRIMVRQAVIKTKDPRQMFLELEQLDEMELNPHGEQPYNEKVSDYWQNDSVNMPIKLYYKYCILILHCILN